MDEIECLAQGYFIIPFFFIISEFFGMSQGKKVLVALALLR